MGVRQYCLKQQLQDFEMLRTFAHVYLAFLLSFSANQVLDQEETLSVTAERRFLHFYHCTKTLLYRPNQ